MRAFWMSNLIFAMRDCPRVSLTKKLSKYGVRMRTPYLLNFLVKETRGQSLIANIKLLIQNARIAIEIACAL